MRQSNILEIKNTIILALFWAGEKDNY